MIKNWTPEILSKYDIVITDTSTLMHADELARFINENKTLFATEGKKIIIPKEVRAELARHIGKVDKTKSEMALNASDAIASVPEMFEVEGGSLGDDEIFKVFADNKIYGRIAGEADQHSVLLLTEDKYLATDVMKLNHMNFCFGKSISAGYLKNGRIYSYSCADSKETGMKAEKSNLDDFIRECIAKNSEQEPADVPYKKDNNAGWIWIPASVVSLVAGIVLGHYCNIPLPKFYA